jgi:hypothetical protein
VDAPSARCEEFALNITSRTQDCEAKCACEGCQGHVSVRAAEINRRRESARNTGGVSGIFGPFLPFLMNFDQFFGPFLRF